MQDFLKGGMSKLRPEGKLRVFFIRGEKVQQVCVQAEETTCRQEREGKGGAWPPAGSASS